MLSLKEFLIKLFGQLVSSDLFQAEYFPEPKRWKVTITSSLPVVSLQHIDVSSLGVSSHCSGGRTPVRGTSARAFPEQNQQNPQLTTVLSWLEYQYIEILHRIVQLLVSVSLCHWHKKLIRIIMYYLNRRTCKTELLDYALKNSNSK